MLLIHNYVLIHKVVDNRLRQKHMLGNAIFGRPFQEKSKNNFFSFHERQRLRFCFKVVEEFFCLFALCPFTFSNEDFFLVNGFGNHV